MKPVIRAVMIVLILITCTSWGFFAHRRINHVAVFTLPKAMAGFYQANIDFITAHAVDPDKKRYVDSLEAPRHFFNADHYGKRPFMRMPVKWKEAAKKYSKILLNKYGTVLWKFNISITGWWMPLKRHDTTDILKTSANLGYYIADAHVPLHLTKNYDGQLTHQQGIHALLESRIPELFSDQYNYNIGKPNIENPLNEAFKICRASFKCVDSTCVLNGWLAGHSCQIKNIK